MIQPKTISSSAFLVVAAAVIAGVALFANLWPADAEFGTNSLDPDFQPVPVAAAFKPVSYESVTACDDLSHRMIERVENVETDEDMLVFAREMNAMFLEVTENRCTDMASIGNWEALKTLARIATVASATEDQLPIYDPLLDVHSISHQTAVAAFRQFTIRSPDRLCSDALGDSGLFMECGVVQKRMAVPLLY